MASEASSAGATAAKGRAAVEVERNDGMSVTSHDGSIASDANAREASVPGGPAQPTAIPVRLSREQQRRRSLADGMSGALPPSWVMALVFKSASVYQGLPAGWNLAAPDSPAKQDAVLREHGAVLRIFLHRTRQQEFNAWAIRPATVLFGEDVLEAAELVLARFVAARERVFPHR